MYCVEHVRRDSPWVPSFVAKVEDVANEVEGKGLSLLVGLEAKMLDERGTLDLPPHLPGTTGIVIADHQWPWGERCYTPREIHARWSAQAVEAEVLIRALVSATGAAMRSYPGAQLAHLFSILPKAGLSEDDVPMDALDELVVTAKETGARVEISEKWRCPSPRTLRRFAQAGVPLVASSDAHHASEVGAYPAYVPVALAALGVDHEDQ